WAFLWTLPFLALTARINLAEEPNAPEPTTRPAMSADGDVLNFSLLDYRGRYFELRRLDAKLLVLFFTSPDCPISRQTTPKLQKISEEMRAKGVAVWMVNAMPQDDPSDMKLDFMFEMGRFAPRAVMGDRYVVQGMRGLVSDSILGDKETMHQETRDHVWVNPPTPVVLRDDRQLVSRYFGVKRTCDTLVIDTEKMAVIYRGALDDQFAEGARKPKARANYLRDALEQYLAGKPVSRAATKVHGCEITYDTGPDDQPISYAKQIAPILQNNCINCHQSGDIAPFAMDSYAKVKSWSNMMQETILDRRMPPWHADSNQNKFVHDRTMSAADTQALIRWIKQGSPRGDGEDPLLAVPAPKPAWQLGQPDYIVQLPKQQVPATGVIDWRFIDSDFVMPEDAWLRAAITRPDARQVIHHIIVRVHYPKQYKNNPEEAFLFTTWVPGLPQTEVPKGTGMFLPKGSRFNFEIHYTTDGTTHVDQSEVGLYLAKEKPAMQFETRGFETRDLDIPPGVANAKHTIEYAFKKDTMIYALSPHMHVRGSWFKFELLTPDGKRETLASIPNYDFNWQTNYRLTTPKLAPAGSWMVCTGGYDNSIKNASNPDPTARVHWGPQSWNEMFMGFMDVAEVQSPSAAAVSTSTPVTPAPGPENTVARKAD
ncbi:MAG: Peroxiredoxin, partial [Phycisphaerales bacterium]|nr:Peroxiredoxin [Phycisphaerales bacterium]